MASELKNEMAEGKKSPARGSWKKERKINREKCFSQLQKKTQ